MDLSKKVLSPRPTPLSPDPRFGKARNPDLFSSVLQKNLLPTWSPDAERLRGISGGAVGRARNPDLFSSVLQKNLLPKWSTHSIWRRTFFVLLRSQTQPQKKSVNQWLTDSTYPKTYYYPTLYAI
jgi:hypothetical protein